LAVFIGRAYYKSAISSFISTLYAWFQKEKAADSMNDRTEEQL